VTKAHKGDDPQTQHTGNRWHALQKYLSVEVSLLKRQYRHEYKGPGGEEIVVVKAKLEVEEYIETTETQKQPKAEFFNETEVAAKFEDGIEPDAYDAHQTPGRVKGVFPGIEAVFGDLNEFRDGFAGVDLL